MTTPEIPCIDLTPFRLGDFSERETVVRAWARAFEEVGFATIVGHGVPDRTIEHAYSELMDFFSLPAHDKLQWALPYRVKTRGYLPVGIESVARTRGDEAPPDLCEALVFYGVNFDPPGDLRGGAIGNIYPAQPRELADAVRDYYMAVHGLVGLLMELSACALGLPDDFFAPYFDRFRGVLRCAHYPAQAEAPEPGQLRYGAHSDYGGLTLLRQDDAPGGLQAQARSGEWIDVRPVANSYVINIGDLMARWTNDRWRSTIHRVVNPPVGAGGAARRLSLVMFSGPNDDAVISCLPSCVGPAEPAKYAPVRARDYIQAKLNTSMSEALQAPVG